MRIAVVADIHGNIGALQSVVADLEDTSPDLVVNLGDCLSGPLDPAATADLLMDLSWPTVRGNHDRAMTETPSQHLGRTDRDSAARISERQRAWLAGFPATLEVAPDLFLCHGTPGSDMDYLTERVAKDGSVHPAREVELEIATAGTGRGVVLCGHTHVPRFFRLKSGRIVVNPGSVGLQGYEWDVPSPHAIETGSPHARYLIMDRAGEGWRYQFRVLAYDWDRAAALALACGREDWARALATGYVR
jgi:predicted phosphodiesterase